MIPLISDKVNIAPDLAEDGAGQVEMDTFEGTRQLIERLQGMSVSERNEMRLREQVWYLRRYNLADAGQQVYKSLGLSSFQTTV